MNNRRIVSNNVPFVRMGVTNIDGNENDSKSFSTNDSSNFCKESLTTIDDSTFNVCTVDETYTNECNKNAIDNSIENVVEGYYHPPTLKHQDIENIGEYNDDSYNKNSDRYNDDDDDDDNSYGNNCTFDGFFDSDEDDDGTVNVNIPEDPIDTSNTMTNNESTTNTNGTTSGSNSTNTTSVNTYIMEEPILREFFEQLDNRRTINENSTIYQRWKDEQERELYLLDQTYREKLNQSMNEIFLYYDTRICKNTSNAFCHYLDDNTTGTCNQQHDEHSLSTTCINNNHENEIHRRIQDYQTARYLRNYVVNSTGKRTNMKTAIRQSLPYGISGVFQYISDIRTDLQWVAICADRRTKSLPYLSWLDYIEINIGTANAVAATTISTTSFPYFTCTLAIICTITLIVQFAMNQWHFETMQVNPMVGSSVTVLIRLGAVAYNPIVHSGQYVRLLSSSILHAGIIHWLINIVTVILLVPEIEYTYGSITVAIIFIITAIGGNIVSCLWMNQYQIGVGASGGICGLIGICLTDTIVNWKLFSIPDITIVTRSTSASSTTANKKRNSENKHSYTKNTRHCIIKENGQDTYHLVKSSFPYVKVIISLVLEILLIVLIGFTPYVDQFAHLGGMLYGMCFSCFFIRANDNSIFTVKSKQSIPSSSSSSSRFRCLPLRLSLPSIWRFISISIGLFLYSLTIALLLQSHYMYQQNKNNNNTIDTKNDTTIFTPGTSTRSSLKIPCSSCKYVSCIPFPPWKSINDRWWNCDACDYVTTFQYYHVPVPVPPVGSNSNSTIIKMRCPVGEIVRVVIDISNNDNNNDSDTSSADLKDDGRSGRTSTGSKNNGRLNDIDGKLLRGYCRTLCNV